MVTVPEVKLEINSKIKDIVSKKQTEKYLNDPQLITAEDIVRMGEDVMKWNRQIDTLVKHQFDLINSTSLQEQIYWSSYVASLRDVENQIETDEVKFYLGVLQKKGKFHLTTAFNSIIASLKKMTERATDINGFFKEIKFQ